VLVATDPDDQSKVQGFVESGSRDAFITDLPIRDEHYRSAPAGRPMCDAHAHVPFACRAIREATVQVKLAIAVSRLRRTRGAQGHRLGFYSIAGGGSDRLEVARWSTTALRKGSALYSTAAQRCC